MSGRIWRMIAGCAGLVLAAGIAPEVRGAELSLRPFAEEMATLVKRQYPEARVWMTDTAMEFDFDARGYMIHYRAKNGEWQRAVEEKGPNQHGIVGFLSLRERPDSQTPVFRTDTTDRCYYRELRIIRYVERENRTVYAILRYPEGTPSAFVQSFVVLMNEVEQRLERGTSAEAP